MQAWAADPGGVPEGSPPWVIALYIVAGIVTTLAPLLLVRRNRKAEEPEEADTTSGTTGRAPITQAEQELSVVAQMLAGIEREQERDRQDAAQLRQELTVAQAEITRLAVRTARAEADVESRDRTITRLRQQVDHLQWERQQMLARVQGPTWPGPSRPPTPGT